MTDLPNLHPMFVHFPIALLMAALGLDVVALVARKPALITGSGVVLLFAAAGAIVALATGLGAEDSVALPTEQAAKLIGAHETLAIITLCLTLGLAGWRIAAKLDHPAGTGRTIYLAVLVLACVMVGLTASFGGRLVYGEGVGVRPVMEQLLPKANLPAGEAALPRANPAAEAAEQVVPGATAATASAVPSSTP